MMTARSGSPEARRHGAVRQIYAPSVFAGGEQRSGENRARHNIAGCDRCIREDLEESSDENGHDQPGKHVSQTVPHSPEMCRLAGGRAAKARKASDARRTKPMPRTIMNETIRLAANIVQLDLPGLTSQA
jgi:hypothetical protein